MTIAFVSGVTGSAAANASTTGVDTSGCNLLIVARNYHQDWNSTTFTDTIGGSASGNTWTPLAPSQTTAQARMYYCLNPNVGANHVFTAGSSQTIMFLGFSGVGAYDHENWDNDPSAAETSAETGGTTPTEANSLIISAITLVSALQTSSGANGFTSVDGLSFTNGYSVQQSGYMAYQIQTTLTAIADVPIMTWASGASWGSTTAVFTAAETGGSAAATVPILNNMRSQARIF